jgi:hypothetical protein
MVFMPCFSKTRVRAAKRAGLSEEDTYIISRAETAWKQDPMTMVELTDIPEDEIKRQKKKAIQTAGMQLNVSYTGFMQMGDRKFAIINGLEYTTGDELEQGGKKFIFLIEE